MTFDDIVWHWVYIRGKDTKWGSSCSFDGAKPVALFTTMFMLTGCRWVTFRWPCQTSLCILTSYMRGGKILSESRPGISFYRCRASVPKTAKLHEQTRSSVAFVCSLKIHPRVQKSTLNPWFSWFQWTSKRWKRKKMNFWNCKCLSDLVRGRNVCHQLWHLCFGSITHPSCATFAAAPPIVWCFGRHGNSMNSFHLYFMFFQACEALQVWQQWAPSWVEGEGHRRCENPAAQGHQTLQTADEKRQDPESVCQSQRLVRQFVQYTVATKKLQNLPVENTLAGSFLTNESQRSGSTVQKTNAELPAYFLHMRVLQREPVLCNRNC